MASSSLTAMTLFLLIAINCSGGAAITCGGVLTTASPCVSYVQKGGPSPPPACCDALRSLNDATRTTPDLQTACGCLKTLLPAVGAKPDLVNGLPDKCRIGFPYRYSPTLDCSKLHR